MNSKYLRMLKLTIAIMLLFQISALYAETINIRYPIEIDSTIGTVLNIPIVVENISTQRLLVQADYFNMFNSEEFFYDINKISHSLVLPGSRQVIFLSLTPNSDLLAGKRFFPFSIKDENDLILSTGVIEINHLIHEEFLVTSLNNITYITSGRDIGETFLIENKGTVPIQFRYNGIRSTEMILQPTEISTIYIPFADIANLIETDYWLTYSFDYTLTKILPDELKIENYSIRRIYPIAQITKYPFQHEYYRLPINVSQSYMYDESMFASKSIIRQYITNVNSSGFLGDNNSTLFNLNFQYRHLDYGFLHDDDYYFNMNLRTNKFNFGVGENNYVLDLRDFPKYGNGVELGYFHRGLILERVSMRELYGERAIHNRTSIGYSWDAENYLYYPEQYIKFNYYQKNNRDINGNWVNETANDDDYFGRWFLNSEHEKFILDTQAALSSNFKVNFELYTVREHETGDFSSPAFTAGFLFHNAHVLNRFSVKYDDLNTVNEIPRRINYDNEFNVYSDKVDLYTNVQYRDEYSRMGTGYTDHYISHNISGNLFINFITDYYLRFKVYDSAFGNDYKENEYLFGAMYKRYSYELELLYGVKRIETSPLLSGINYDNIISVNAWVSRWDKYNINLFLSNRTEFDEFEFNMRNQVNIYHRLTRSLNHSIGLYNVYYSMQNWRNYLQLFTNFYYTLPWKHQISLGASYNVNPSFHNQYRYSIMAEYSMPIDIRTFRKSNKKYQTMTFQDYKLRRPVPGVVMEMDNMFFVSNDAGVIRADKRDYNPLSINVLNIPPGYTLHPELSTLSNSKTNHAFFMFAELSNVTIKVNKLSYERVAPNNAELYDNLAYYQNTLINLDNHLIEICDSPLEILLLDTDTNVIVQRGNLNNRGVIDFTGLKAGNYAILINDKFIQDDFVLERVDFKLEFGEKIIKEVLVREKTVQLRIDN